MAWLGHGLLVCVKAWAMILIQRSLARLFQPAETHKGEMHGVITIKSYRHRHTPYITKGKMFYTQKKRCGGEGVHEKGEVPAHYVSSREMEYPLMSQKMLAKGLCITKEYGEHVYWRKSCSQCPKTRYTRKGSSLESTRV